MPRSLENHSEKQMRVDSEKVVNPSVPIEVNFFDNMMPFYQLTEILKDELRVDSDIQHLDGGDSEMTLGECNYRAQFSL
jgi:hypothetical protein